jgi:uncharacterized protein
MLLRAPYTDISSSTLHYSAPWWLPGGNLQTIWSARLARAYTGAGIAYRRERWHTPDADFIDVDFLAAAHAPGAPLMVLFHGLEGSSHSHYALAFAAWCQAQGVAFAVPHFRGCSGELNLAPRAYHSGDYEEIGWILAQLRAKHIGPVVAVGISLGGNALLRWAQEAGGSATRTVQALASLCAPLDLAASGAAIGKGFNRAVYTRMFLATMKPKALRKLAQHPKLFDEQRLRAARDLYAFDNVFTAPLHGFKNTDDYWRRASSKPHLHAVQVPALVVNALNDPFVPAGSLPTQAQVGQYVTLWQPAHGGHVGFAAGSFPASLQGLPHTVGGFLFSQVKKHHG